MSHVMALRTSIQGELREEARRAPRLHGRSSSRPCIAALKDLPNVNAELEGDDIVYKNYYDIGMAVSTEKGLVVPVVRDADRLSLARHRSGDQRFRPARARDGKLKLG